MAKINKKQTSPQVASIASELLRTTKNKNVAKVAASDLSQAHPHSKKKKPVVKKKTKSSKKSS